jgi:predicted lipoprotein with Yx(FWY)xxD motif
VSRMKAYSHSLLAIMMLGLIGAACAADVPALPAPPDPSPVTPTLVPSTPTPAATPTPQATATSSPTATPVAVDYDYDYGYGGGTVSPTASPDAAEVLIGIAPDADGGDYLVGPDGRALYIFTQDQAGVSNCTGSCAQAWPPLIVESDDELTTVDEVSGELGVSERGNGSLQVTYDGAPLYHYAGDTAPGDTSGEGVGDVWFLARP